MGNFCSKHRKESEKYLNNDYIKKIDKKSNVIPKMKKYKKKSIKKETV